MPDNEPFDPKTLREKLAKAIEEGNFFMSSQPLHFEDAADTQDKPEPDPAGETIDHIRSFRLKPKDIRDHLNRFVIRQPEAKKVLSVAICDHYNYVRHCLDDPTFAEREHTKQNVLLLGPTGVGKTYLIRNIAKLLRIPFVKADATKFSETGYVGSDVEEMVRDLVKAADGNTELAGFGIIYIDEVDKIATAGNGVGKDVSGRGVQINMLKLMEETEVSLFSPNDVMGQMRAMMGGGKSSRDSINTRNILFILSGAFGNLAERVKKRIDHGSMGFAVKPAISDDLTDYLQCATTSDFIDYGFEPEFIGRIPVRVACESLTADDLAEILTNSEGSLLRQYEDDFRGYGIELTFTPEAIEAVAKLAYLEKTGARGLATVLERILREFKFELPSTGIRSLEVTTELIDDPHGTLHQLIVKNRHLMDDVWDKEIETFCKAFEQITSVELTFTDEAVDRLIELSADQDKTLRSILDEKFRDYAHGLAIILRNGGSKQLTISREAVDAPDETLSSMVVASFQAASDGKEAASDGEES